MDFWGELCLLNKAKSVISSLSGMIMLWASGTPSTLKIPINGKGVLDPALQHDPQLGLKTLIYTEAKTTPHHQEIVHSYNIALTTSVLLPPKTTPLMTNTSWPPSSSSSLVLDDVIGTDSGVHILIGSNDISSGQTTSRVENKCSKNASYKDRIHDKRIKQRPSESKNDRYPPRIPWLARKGNLVGQVLWVWTRHYEDGKLILQCHPLERHEYFEARRDDGRLIIDLVSIENNLNHNHHQTESRSIPCCEEDQLIQFGEGDHKVHDHNDDESNGNDQSVAAFESLSDQLSCLEDNRMISTSSITPKGFSGNYGCGMFMEIHERVQASSSAPLVRHISSVIMQLKLAFSYY